MESRQVRGRPGAGRRVHAAVLGGLLLGSCANPCERLCDVYFQMDLRCDLLPCDADAANPDITCSAAPAEGACPDSNQHVQNTEYEIQQCQADYRRLRPATEGQPSEADACNTWVSTLDRMLTEYDATTDPCSRLVLCEEFRSIQTEMGLE